jgi:hypothetical protein
MSTTEYCFSTTGGARLFRAAADAMEGTLDEYYSASGWDEDRSYFESVLHLKQDSVVKALTLGELVGIFSIFAAGYFGQKFLDEIYERTLKRPIGEFLDKLFTPTSPVHGNRIELRDVVYLKDIDTVVVVRGEVGAKNTQEIKALFLQAHRVAHAYLEAYGPCAPVHCHQVIGGTVSIEPKLYLSLQQLNRDLQEGAALAMKPNPSIEKT